MRVLLLGGTSEIGLAIVRRLAAEEPVRVTLLGRDRTRLEQALSALDGGRGIEGEVDALDAEDLATHS